MKVVRFVPHLAVAAALVVAGYGWGLWQTSSSTAEMARLGQRIDKLERQVGAPANASPVSSSTTGSQPGAAARSPSSGSVAGGYPEVLSGNRSLSPQEIARGRAARKTELDAAFRNDSMDMRGANQAESQLAEAAASDDLVESGTTPIAIDTQCRLSSCRVLTRFAADSDAEGWANLYVLSAARTLASAETLVTPLPDGTVELAIYGRRQ